MRDFMIEIEKAFREITKMLLGAELTHIDEYQNWLGCKVPLPSLAESVISGKDVWIPPTLNFLGKNFNRSKIISMDEMDKVNKNDIPRASIENVSIKELISTFIKPVAFFCGNFRYQTHENVEKSSGAGGGKNLYYCEDVYLGVKNIAFSNYALHCENIFGSYGITDSQFCIHAYNSTEVARCFEVDCCSNSSDLYFSHNCENVRDSMFCFNAKNLRHAIGNVQLPQDQYRLIKSKILNGVLKELKETKNLRYDVFNLGDSNG